MSFTSSPEQTETRFRLLERYMSREVLTTDRTFVCSSRASCERSVFFYTQSGSRRAGAQQFIPGQLSHVGTHYDLQEDGHDWRVVFIGMEVGRPPAGITLAQRREDQETAIFDQTFRTRKPHMKGTTSALRVLFGRGLGDQYDDE